MNPFFVSVCVISVRWFCRERSPSYPGVEFVFAEIASTSQPIRTSFLTMLALVRSSGRFLTAKTHILFGVELRLTLLVFKIVMFYKFTFQHNPQCSSPNPSHCEGFCTTRIESFALFVSSDSFLNAFPRILCSWTRTHRTDVHFLICPHDSFRVLCVISVQCFSPGRSSSYPGVEFGLVAFAFLSDNYPHVRIGRLR